VIHFEIFTTDEALNSFFVNSKTTSEIGTKGTWGDSYFVVKANTAVVPEHPFITKRKADYTAAHPPAAAGAHPNPHAPRPPDNTIGHHAFPSGTGGTVGDDGASCTAADKNLLIRIGFRNGAKYTTTWLDEGQNKAPTLLTSEQGDKDVDYEYDLYAIATELYPGCPSAGYELLRFGKVIGPDSVVAEEKHNWQWVTYGAGQQGYIDLADASVQVLSDADFPYWLGWQKVEGGLFPESGQCNMLSMLDLLGVARDLGATKTDPSVGALSVAPDVADDKVASQELKSFFAIHPHVRDWAQRLVCKFPSEWDKGNNGRWVKLKQKDGLGPGKDGPFLNNDDEYNKHITFLEKLEWWTDAGMGDSNVWHFHPFRFIQQFRRCGWLSADELVRAVPGSTENAGRFKVAINKTMRKYMGFDSVRRSHFLGQMSHETGDLAGPMLEVGNSAGSKLYETDLDYYRGPDSYSYFHLGLGYEKLHNTLGNEYYPITGTGDGIKFRGRGSLQITGRDSYSTYWTYRGWILKSSFDAKWWSISGWWDSPRNQSIRPAIIPDPQRISARASGNEHNPIDVGGWYWADKKINMTCSEEINSTSDAPTANSVSSIINRYDVPTFPARKIHVETAKKILCDGV